MYPQKKSVEGTGRKRLPTSSVYRSKKEEAPETCKKSARFCFLQEGTLDCEICLDVLHNAMNISPCNHKFCAACIYEWNDSNLDCPKCRWAIQDVSRDYLINNIVEQYLQEYPERRRSQSTLNQLDERELHYLEKFETNKLNEDSWNISNISVENDDDSYDVSSEDNQNNENDSENDILSESNSDYSDFEDSFEDARRAQVCARIELLRREKEERDKTKEMEKEKSVGRRSGYKPNSSVDSIAARMKIRRRNS